MEKPRSAAFALAFVIVAGLAGAQVYSPARPLYVLKTGHFTIIFPEDCRDSAKRLYGMAEEVYADVAGRLEVDSFPRIPVLITPDSDDPNGYCLGGPLRIVLYRTSVSPNSGFAGFADPLRDLFAHELAHALTITRRSPLYGFLAAVFSDWIDPAFALAPYSLLEGAAILSESSDGYGRANDASQAAIVRQDIIEGRFKSLAQAAGAWEGYPPDIQYAYGGCFASYLVRAYGEGKFAELWREMGKGSVVGFEGIGPFKGAFEKVYGLRPEKAWKEFGEAMAMAEPVVAERHPLDSRSDWLTSPLASDGERLYWADTEAVWSYDASTGRRVKLFDNDWTVSSLSPSADGERLLVCSYRYAGKEPKAAMRVFDIVRRRWEKTEFPAKLVEASWLQDGGVVAARLSGFTRDIVLVKDGKEEIIFSGTDRLVPSKPYAFGRDGIAFILQEAGANRIVLMDLETKVLRTLKAAPDSMRIRHLFSDGSTLLFAYDLGDGLLRLGRWNEDAGLALQTAFLSGGVQYPVIALGDIYYAGFFSQGQSICRFPSANPALALGKADSSWEPLSPEEGRPLVESSVVPEPGRYSSLPWLLKPTIWFPQFSVNEAVDQLPNGVGAYFETMDPAESHSAYLSVTYLWNSRFANASFGWDERSLPVRAIIEAGDELSVLNTADPYGSRLARRLSASIGLEYMCAFMPAVRTMTLIGEAAVAFEATGEGAAGEAATNPYAWRLGAPFAAFSARVSYSDMNGGGLAGNDPRGFTLEAGYGGCWNGPAPALPEGVADVSLIVRLPFLGFRAFADAAFAAHPDIALGTRGPLRTDGSAYSGGFGYPEYAEYVERNAEASWLYLYQDVGLGRVFRTDAALPFSLYLRSIGLGGGYRSAYAGWNYMNSVYTGIDFAFSLSRGLMSGVKATVRVEYALPLSGEIPGRFSFSAGIE